jgi:hypothetical protein
MTNSIKLSFVNYMPKELEPGILYVSEEFNVAGHMCPCGCGNKIITPLGPIDWSLTLKKGKPSLDPSIGNWQIPCRSHYWIRNGLIEWSYQWNEKQILAGRQKEEERKKMYYHTLERRKKGTPIFTRFLNWLLRKINE